MLDIGKKWLMMAKKEVDDCKKLANTIYKKGLRKASQICKQIDKKVTTRSKKSINKKS